SAVRNPYGPCIVTRPPRRRLALQDVRSPGRAVYQLLSGFRGGFLVRRDRKPILYLCVIGKTLNPPRSGRRVKPRGTGMSAPNGALPTYFRTKNSVVFAVPAAALVV